MSLRHKKSEAFFGKIYRKFPIKNAVFQKRATEDKYWHLVERRRPLLERLRSAGWLVDSGRCVFWGEGGGFSVTHFFWDFVRIEDSRHGHLDLVFFLLGLTQGRLALLQEQVRRVLARELLDLDQEVS